MCSVSQCNLAESVQHQIHRIEAIGMTKEEDNNKGDLQTGSGVPCVDWATHRRRKHRCSPAVWDRKSMANPLPGHSEATPSPV